MKLDQMTKVSARVSVCGIPRHGCKKHSKELKQELRQSKDLPPPREVIERSFHTLSTELKSQKKQRLSTISRGDRKQLMKRKKRKRQLSARSGMPIDISTKKRLMMNRKKKKRSARSGMPNERPTKKRLMTNIKKRKRSARSGMPIDISTKSWQEKGTKRAQRDADRKEKRFKAPRACSDFRIQAEIRGRIGT